MSQELQCGSDPSHARPGTRCAVQEYEKRLLAKDQEFKLGQEAQVGGGGGAAVQCLCESWKWAVEARSAGLWRILSWQHSSSLSCKQT